MKAKPSRWVSVIFAVLSLIYLIAFVLFVSHRGELAATINQANPGLAPSRLDQMVNQALIIGGGYHLVLALVFGWLMVMTMRAWNGVRITALIVLGLDIAGALYSGAPTLLPAERPYIITVQLIAVLLQFAVIAVLWRSHGRRLPARATPTGTQEPA